MSSSSNVLNFVHFADDTTVFTAGHDVDELSRVVEGELGLIDRWLSINRLSLNVNKTSFMITSNRPTNNVTLKIRNSEVARASSAKFLGIIVDERLSFAEHVESVCSKISRAVGALRRVSSLVPVTLMRTLYFTLIYPHLIYGVVVWGNCGVTSICRVKSLHRRAVRLLPCERGGCPFSFNNIFDFEQLYQYFSLIKLFRILKLGEHRYFFDRIADFQTSHLYPTRFKTEEKINPPIYRKTKCNSFFLTQSVKFWNKLSVEVRNSTSLYAFKRSLKNILIVRVE